MCARLWLLLLLLPLVASQLGAQDKPDFSGMWILEDAEPRVQDVSRTLTVTQLVARTNAFGAPMTPFFRDLTIERQFDSGVRSDTYQIGVVGGVVGGVPEGQTDRDNPQAQSRWSVRWVNDRLYIETGRYSGPTREYGPYTEHTEVWWLDPQSRLQVIVSDRQSDRGHRRSDAHAHLHTAEVKVALQNETPNPRCARAFPFSGHATSTSMMNGPAPKYMPPPVPRSNR